MPLGTEVDLGPGHIVLDIDPDPPPIKWAQPTPIFSPYVYCGQTARWIKVSLGLELGIGPRHIVLDGDPAPALQKGAQPSPIFGPCLLWPNGWMDQDTTWYGGRPRPRPHCARWGPNFPDPQKGHSPQFSAHICGG